MDANEAQAAYKSIRAQFDTGQITLDDYNKKIAELRYQDNTGMWWAISSADGSWLKWTGTAWVPAFAQPASAAPQAPVQSAPRQAAPQPVAEQPATKPSWYIPPVSSGQQKPAAGQPAATHTVQHPVQQPSPQPAPSSYYIPPTSGAQQPAAQQPAAAVATKPARNWIGIGSLILGILSWILYPYLLGFAAIIVGGYSVYTIKKTTGKIAFVAIAGVLIGLASIVTDNFYFILFPPSQGMLLTFWLVP
ncbi:MAG: hypothetical protein OS112_06300 [Methanoregula sp.]|nr:MAG: hypothetical protein OS112_06300 [Methanoregula sp.]